MSQGKNECEQSKLGDEDNDTEVEVTMGIGLTRKTCTRDFVSLSYISMASLTYLHQMHQRRSIGRY
jgi:hypothetical protein